jgi:uncharacterized membrane protein YecN with MAPEG domain
MSTPELPPLEPVREDGVRAIQIGLGLWVVAGLVLLVQRDQLAERGTQWWVAVCGAGLLIGIVHLASFSRRRVLVRARERERPAPAGPTG